MNCGKCPAAKHEPREHQAARRCGIDFRLRTTGTECPLDISLMAEVAEEAGYR